MALAERVGFLGGGNMAEAIVRGLIETGTPKDRIGVSDPRDGRLREFSEGFEVHTTASNAELSQWADVVVLAVKPQIAPGVMAELVNAKAIPSLLISIAAGLTCQTLESGLPGARTVRVMPNTPALVGCGASALCKGATATDNDLALAQTLFDAVGITEVVSEAQMDAVTGLSGSGPAFVFIMLEAMSDAGVKMGLSRDTATRLAAQTLYGSAALQMQTGNHPGVLKDMVTSPAGTTISGVHALEAGGIRTTLISAIEAAATRAAVLGAATPEAS